MSRVILRVEREGDEVEENLGDEPWPVKPDPDAFHTVEETVPATNHPGRGAW